MVRTESDSKAGRWAAAGGRTIAGTTAVAAIVVLINDAASGRTNGVSEIADLVGALSVLGGLLLWALRSRRGDRSPSPIQVRNAARDLREATRHRWPKDHTAAARVRWTTEHPGGLRTDPPVGSSDLLTCADTIAAQWDLDAQKRMLILGAAGSGKSTLAKALVGRLAGRHDGPAPVLLSLRSYHPQRYVSFEKWITERVTLTYPFLRNTTRFGLGVVASLLAAHRLVLVLDGLDELSDPARAAVVQFLRQHPFDQIVVTSRTDVPHRSTVFGATLTLLPLDTPDLLAYLYPQGTATTFTVHDQPKTRGTKAWLRLASALGGGRSSADTPPATHPSISAPEMDRWGPWQPVAGALWDPASAVATVLPLPLYANLARAMFIDDALVPADLLNHPDADSLSGYLMHTYLETVYDNPVPAMDAPYRQRPTPWGTAAVRRGMQLLATHMDAPSTTHEHADGQRNLAWWNFAALIDQTTWIILTTPISAAVYALTVDLPSGLRRGGALGFTVAILINLSRGKLHGWSSGCRTGVAGAIGVAAVGWVQIGLTGAGFDALELGIGIGLSIGLCRRLTEARLDLPPLPTRASRPTRRVYTSAALIGTSLGLLMGGIDTWRYGMDAGLIRMITTGLGATISLSIPATLIVMLRVLEPTRQPPPLNAKLRGGVRPLAQHAGVGLLCGVSIGIAGGVIAGIRQAAKVGLDRGAEYGSQVGIIYGLCVGLGIGLVGGIVHWLNRPTETAVAADPRSTYHGARIVTWTYLLIPAVSGALVLYMTVALHLFAPLASTPGGNISGSVSLATTGAALGLCIGGVFATAFCPWPRYLVATVSLSLRDRTPINLVRLCEQAERAGLLRHDAASYQFRHEAIRVALATHKTTSNQLDPAATSRNQTAGGLPDP